MKIRFDFDAFLYDLFTYGLKTFLGLTVIAASIVVIGTHFPPGLVAIAGFFLGVVVSAIIEGVNIEL